MHKFLNLAIGVMAVIGGLSVSTVTSQAARNYAVATPGASVAAMPWAVPAFCKNNPGQCRGSGATSVVASAELVNLLQQVNSRVNRAIRFRAEPLDEWSTNPRYGDCEDFALSKRSALIAMGVPGASLRIGITKTRGGEPHAVLVVMTDAGRLILDNRSGAVREVSRTEYRLEAISGRNLTSWVAG